MPCAARAKPEPRDDQLPRHEPVVDDLAPVVDVVDELVERADALRQAALDRRPLGRRDDPRHEVERERAVADRPVGVRAGRVERDALLHEDRVAAAAGRGQRLGPERGQRLDQRLRVRRAATRPRRASRRRSRRGPSARRHPHIPPVPRIVRMERTTRDHSPPCRTCSICIAGVTGWTGRALADAVAAAEDLELRSGVSRSAAGRRDPRRARVRDRRRGARGRRRAHRLHVARRGARRTR